MDRYRVLEPGRYPARIHAVEVRLNSEGNRYFRWVWDIENPDGGTAQASATSSPDFGPSSKKEGRGLRPSRQGTGNGTPTWTSVNSMVSSVKLRW